MSHELAIDVQGVWKKFRRGELHDSLRDLIPALAKGLFNRSAQTPLSKREFWALRDVSFTVPRGQCFGIIGPNGAGKSTLLKLLTKIIRPNRGTYQVRGRVSALIEVGSGFHPDLTGRENIYLNGAILGMKRAEIKAKEERIIEFSGIPESVDTPVKRYSSGMKARLGFAVAAHLEPDVLLVDEVLSVGDLKFRRKCFEHMHELIRSDVTVVFISHVLDQIRTMCQQTMVMQAGGIVYNGETDGAIRKYIELLADGTAYSGGDRHAAAEIRNIRFCDTQGNEVLQWQARKPAVAELDFVVHRPLSEPTVQLNFHDLGGIYLGTADAARQGLAVPRLPGVYRMRFVLDPMPLADNDYAVRFMVLDGPGASQQVWATDHMPTISVRGSGLRHEMITCDGSWEMLPAEAPVTL